MTDSRITRLAFAILACSTFVFSTPAAGQNPSSPHKTPGKMKVGVAAVKITPALKESLRAEGRLNAVRRVAEAIDGQLIDRLHNTRKFQIIARSDLAAIDLEQQFGASGNVDASEDSARRFQLHGLDYVVVPTIEHFIDASEKLAAEGGQVLARRRRIQLSAVTKIYDTSSGSLKESATSRLERIEARRGNPRERRTGGARSDALLSQLPRLMARKVAQRIVDILYPAKIVGRVNEHVFINRGDGTDIEAGQVWRVFALGDPMVDPDTGASLGNAEVPVGRIRISRVTPEFSRAEVIEDFGIEKRQVVRPAHHGNPGDNADAVP